MAALGDTRLKTFEHHIEDMRSLTLCKICLKPFYEPFILACGHTYCYGCLNSWFGGAADRRKRRNCPDCRAEVVTQPAPNYLLRDLVHLFINRRELLPEDETVEEHNKGKAEEAARIATDRSGRGLFGGVFDSRGAHYFGLPIVDHEDHVLRCPQCAYELEDGACEQCGWGTPQNAYFSDFTDDDLSGLDDDESIISMTGLPRFSIGGPRRFYGIGSEGDDSGSDMDDSDSLRDHSDEPNQYDENDDFIDNGDDLGEVDEEEEEDDDDDVTGFSDISTAPSTIRGGEFTDTVRSGMPTPWSESNLSSSPVHRRQSSPMRMYYTSSDASDASDNENTTEATTDTPTRRGRNAIVISDDEEDEDEDESVTNSTITHSTITNSTITNSDEESDEEHDSERDSESEDSDDTILPAQSRSRRQQRLNGHRNRRSNHHPNQPSIATTIQRSSTSQPRNQTRTAQSHRQGPRRGRPVGYAY